MDVKQSLHKLDQLLQLSQQDISHGYIGDALNRLGEMYELLGDTYNYMDGFVPREKQIKCLMCGSTNTITVNQQGAI